jgi:hypothetical protein
LIPEVVNFSGEKYNYVETVSRLNGRAEVLSAIYHQDGPTNP